MQTLGEHLQELRVDEKFRYPIAIAFKTVGRSRSQEQAQELAEAYQTFIACLPLPDITKEALCNDMFSNWICHEWVDSFIDGGRLPCAEDGPDAKPLTTNNFTERMHKSVEGRHLGIQPVNKFIEQLFGITSTHSNIVHDETMSRLVFGARQVTYWNSWTIEHQEQSPKNP